MDELQYIAFYKKNIDRIHDKDYYLMSKIIRKCEINGSVFYQCKLEFNILSVLSDSFKTKQESYNDALRIFFEKIKFSF